MANSVIGDMKNKCPKCRRNQQVYTKDGRRWSMALPPIDNGTDSLVSPREKSPFAQHQKAYLSKKGYKITDIYSLHRHRGGSNTFVGSDVNLPSIEELTPRRLRERNKTPGTNCMWKPNDSVKAQGVNDAFYNHLVKGMISDSSIPGHLQLRDTKSRRLGKGLTRAHLKELLSEEKPEEKPVIPNVFYHHDDENDAL